MQRSLYVPLALIGLAAVTVPSSVVASWRAAGSPKPTPFDPPTSRIEELQRMAEAGCKCARTKQLAADKNACWQAFDAAARVPHSQARGDACWPISTHLLCLDDDWDKCLTTGYQIIPSGDLEFCTAEEAEEAENLYLTIDNGVGTEAEQSQAMGRAYGALRRFARELAEGRRVVTTTPGVGCFSDG